MAKIILASKIGCNLQDAVRAKMDINEVRKWKVAENGTLSHIRGTDPREVEV